MTHIVPVSHPMNVLLRNGFTCLI